MARTSRPLEPEDLGSDDSTNPRFADLIATRVSRRPFTVGGLGSFAVAMLGCGSDPHEARAAVISGFRFVRSDDPAVDSQHDPDTVRKQKDAANPRDNNVHGRIIRMRDRAGDVAATAFDWEMVVLVGTAASPNPGAQGTIDGDAFSSPDGVMFDQHGRLWISTDAADRLTFANQSGTGTDWAGLGNDTMLAMDTRTGRVKRFLVAPDGAEVCGMARSGDGRSLFVNIQHPGSEQPRWNPDGTVAPPTATMTWPDMVPVADGGIQRSCTVVITRQDGGLIGIA